MRPIYTIDIDKKKHVQKQAARFVANNKSKPPGTVNGLL